MQESIQVDVLAKPKYSFHLKTVTLALASQFTCQFKVTDIINILEGIPLDVPEITKIEYNVNIQPLDSTYRHI